MMKIVYLSNSIIPSHTANSVHVMKMCQAFAKNGHKVVLLAPEIKGEYKSGVGNIFDYYGVSRCFTVRKLPFLHPRKNSYRYLISTLIYSLFILLEILRIKPNIVYGRYLSGCYVAAKMRFRTIFEAHSPIWNSRLEKFIFERIVPCKNFDRLVVISNALKDMYLAKGHLNSSKIQVAHDGADEVSDFEALKDWPGRKSNLQVGYTGNLYVGRGIEIMLQLALLLKDVDFHVVGGTKKDMERFKKKHDLPNVFFHGHVTPKKVYRYLNSCDVLLAGYQDKVSVWGGEGDTSKFMSPIKIFEYMSSKKAIIASDLPVLKEVLNEKTAIFVPPNDIKLWKAAICALKNSTLRKELGNAAYKAFRANHTWNIRAKNVIS
ncbi:MAG: glycosyltransferase family 4 protein [Desulfobulbaceae bacterium]|nr:glycosyltransferase family 4 protein [Desulfobulbaceae bacterium]